MIQRFLGSEIPSGKTSIYVYVDIRKVKYQQINPYVHNIHIIMEYCMCTFILCAYPTHDDSVFLRLDMDPAQVTTVFIEILTAFDGETRAQAKPRQMSLKI